MRSSHWYSVLLVVLMTTQTCTGQEVGDYKGLPPDLAAAATAYDLAQSRANRAELERLLADDYTLASMAGTNQTKAQFISDALAPGSKATYVAITKQVRKVWPNGAVLGGMVDVKGFNRGKPYVLRARFVDVWAKRDGRWQVIFTQIHSAP